MSQQSAFDRQNIEESALDQPPGLLEQLNLPPELIKFIRQNQRAIWIATACISVLVVAVAGFNQYTTYREEKASSALTSAMQAEGESKKEMLVKVVDDYGATSAGLWGRIELAHLSVEEGEFGKAIQQFSKIKNDVSSDNPLMPLILNTLGVLFEKNNELDKAVYSFNELSTYKGFEVSSFEALGRLYEAKGDKAKAVEMYEKSLATETETGLLLTANPNKETIQARINYLKD